MIIWITVLGYAKVNSSVIKHCIATEITKVKQTVNSKWWGSASVRSPIFSVALQIGGVSLRAVY